MPLSRGFRFGSYEIVDLIGAGGMGEVYRARDVKLDRTVAIKVLPGTARDPAQLARFRREARMLAALNHPHIAQIYGLEEHDADLALAMEFVEGETLASVLREARGHRVPWRDAVAMAGQIVDALDAAHAQSIVHRDLKPANVMRRHDGVIKVLDFGVAKPAPASSGPETTSTAFVATEPGAIVGTAAYMSPEQARGLPIDQRADIWAFGCVVFEMLSGRRAFDGATRSDVVAAVLNGSPAWEALPPDLPRSLTRLLHRCISADVRERLRAIGDAKLDLRDALQEGASPAAARPTPDRRGYLIAAAAIVLAAVTIAFTQRRPAPVGPAPSFETVSFRRGYVHSARFGADHTSVIYGAFYDGGPALYETRIGRPDARPLSLGPTELFAVSRTGELAIGMAPEFPLTFLNPGRLAALPLGGAPRELTDHVNAADYSPDGRSLVAAIVDNQSRIEWPLGNAIYKTEGTVGSLRISPSGDRAAFFEYGPTTSVKVIDRQGRAETFSDGWQIVSGGLAWRPDGQEVWFTGTPVGGDLGQRSRLFAVAAGAKPRVVLNLPGGVRLQDIAPDGRVLITNVHASNSVFVSTSAGREVDLSWFGGSIVNDITADGARVAIIEPSRQGEAGFVLFHRPTNGGPAVRITDGVSGFESRFSDDGRYVASVENGGRIRIDPIGGGAPLHLVDPGWTPVALAWTTGGRELVYSAANPNREIVTFRRAPGGGAPVRLAGACRLPGLVVDPSGRTAACADQGGITFISLDGGPPRSLSTSEPPGQLIRWNSDGRTLQSYRSSDLPGAILGTDVRTGAVRRVRSLTADDMSGIWRIHPVVATADGQHYAYSASRSMGELLVFSGLR